MKVDKAGAVRSQKTSGAAVAAAAVPPALSESQISQSIKRSVRQAGVNQSMKKLMTVLHGAADCAYM